MSLNKINHKLFILLLPMIISACSGGGGGGGGGGSSEGDGVTAPKLSNITSAETYELYRPIKDLSFKNSGGSITGCEVKPDLPKGLNRSDSCVISGTPTIAVVKTEYTVIATNSKGSDSATVFITTEQNKPTLKDVSESFELGNAIPSFTLSSSAGVEITTCKDTDNTLSKIGLAVKVSPDKTGCVVSGTTPTKATEGTTVHVITAVNGAGDGNSINLTIRIARSLSGPPSISDASDQIYTKGLAITPVLFINTGGKLGSCTETGLPTGLSVAISGNACEITGTPASIQTATVATITATNNDGSSAAKVKITVNAVSFTLSGISDSSVVENTVYTSTTPTISGNPIGSLDYSLDGDDASLFTVNAIGIVNMVARDFEKPADNNKNNTYNYTLKATDDDSNKATLTIVVTVTDVNDNAPKITSSSTATVAEGISDTDTILSVTFTDADDDANGNTTYAVVTDTDKLFEIDSSGVVSLQTGKSLNYETKPSHTIGITVNDGVNTSSEQTITINISLNDPLYQFQWHLNNTGQTSFAEKPGTVGADLNMAKTTKKELAGKGLTGKGVQIAVVDSGLEIAHEDLVDNIESGKSCNIDFVSAAKFCSNNDPTSASTKGGHGTSVAGLIAATGWNSLGGRGVAPGAKLRGFNLLGNRGTYHTADAIKSLGGDPLSQDVDIFNQSFGVSPLKAIRINPALDTHYWYGVNKLRNGKGAIYIKSAGNGFISNRSGNKSDCTTANNIDVSCENANMDPTNAQVHQIVVGAINADDKVSSYSTHGSNIWIGSYGGEYGKNISYHGITNLIDNIADNGNPKYNYKDTGAKGTIASYSSSPYGKPAMVTTDQSTCTKGYTTAIVDLGHQSLYTDGVAAAKTTPFHDTRAGQDGATHNADCNYTSTFNGSSATPVLSGVVALMLEANPDLTWRDVKHILASTATQIDANKAAVYTKVNGKYLILADAWITNAAGFKFHNAYGFGKVNVDAAVAMAANNYTTLATFTKGEFKENSTLGLTIPDYEPTGVTNINSVTDSLIIEAVQIEVNITHTFPRDLAIKLTSPSGTNSILFNASSGFAKDDDGGLTNMQLLSNAFYGENSAGDWTLRVIDTGNGNTGTLNSWKIKIYGR